jgi:hypothetical protein
MSSEPPGQTLAVGTICNPLAADPLRGPATECTISDYHFLSGVGIPVIAEVSDWNYPLLASDI